MMPTMEHHSKLPTMDWVQRVNHSWIVRSRLNEQADAWLRYLEERDDERLQTSCETARAMCALREPLEDPKPWFYVGLFSEATAAEAERFLASHRTTKAALPAMVDDEEICRWCGHLSDETRHLLDRLRQGLAESREAHHVKK